MRIKIVCLILAVNTVGCERSTTLPVSESPMKEACGHMAENVANTVRDRQKYERAEEILRRDLSSIPFAKRYNAVLEKAADLRGVLNGMASNNAAYVILTATRLQKEFEGELKSTMSVPEKEMEPIMVSQGGVRYRLMDRNRAIDFERKNREAMEIREYHRQLRHFLAFYPQRIDSPYVRTIIERMPSDERARLIVEIERILGRNPYCNPVNMKRREGQDKMRKAIN